MTYILNIREKIGYTILLSVPYFLFRTYYAFKLFTPILPFSTYIIVKFPCIYLIFRVLFTTPFTTPFWHQITVFYDTLRQVSKIEKVRQTLINTVFSRFLIIVKNTVIRIQ